jgi:hypothetical protein
MTFLRGRLGRYLLPASTPRGIVMRLNAELNSVLAAPAIVERFTSVGSVLLQERRNISATTCIQPQNAASGVNKSRSIVL